MCVCVGCKRISDPREWKSPGNHYGKKKEEEEGEL
jgi:hypothetical protein